MTLTTTKKILIFLIVLSFLLPIPQLANEVSAQGRQDMDYDLGSGFTPQADAAMGSCGLDFGCHLREFSNQLLLLILKGVLGILLIIIGIPVFIATAVISFILLLFNNAITALITVPVTQAPVVMDMWVFVRDFANVFFILAFVVIGLATILKIESYKFQKTLPLLIIMALLMNFSLILVGFIVDIGNILTSLFLEGVQGRGGAWDEFLSYGVSYLTGIGSAMEANSTGELVTIGLGYASYGIVLLAFYALAAVIFGTIIFIFVLRIAILWILAILSPLAFISYIFVSTRKMIWDRWLKNLIQWSVIAAPILFFLFLGFATLQLAPTSISGIVTDMGYSPATVGDMVDPGSLPGTKDFGELIGGIIAAIITPIIALVMILVGILISMSFVPEGADKAISAAKSSGSAVLQGARKTAPVAATEKFFREKLERTPFRSLVGGRGAWAQEMNTEKERQKKILSSMTTKEDQEAYVNDTTLSRWKKDAAAAALFDLRTDKNKPIDENLFKKHGARAERGGADMGKVYMQNPVHRIGNEEKFRDAIKKMSSKDAEGLTVDVLSNPKKDLKIQNRIVMLLERLTMYSQQQVRKLSENMDPETRRAVVGAIDGSRDEIRRMAINNGRSDIEVRKSMKNIDLYFGNK